MVAPYVIPAAAKTSEIRPGWERIMNLFIFSKISLIQLKKLHDCMLVVTFLSVQGTPQTFMCRSSIGWGYVRKTLRSSRARIACRRMGLIHKLSRYFSITSKKLKKKN